MSRTKTDCDEIEVLLKNIESTLGIIKDVVTRIKFRE
jgi:hypothetical protein